MTCSKTESTLTETLARLRQRLYPCNTASHQLPQHPDSWPFATVSDWRPAAVLVPILVHADPDKPSQLLLTVRAAGMDEHAGQVALPGGRPQAEDDDVLATALREAEEEVGLDRSRVEPLGLGPVCLTISAYRVVPVVALVHCGTEGFQAAACAREVSAVFTLPLSHVSQPQHYARHVIHHGDQRHSVISLRSPKWPIWGVTAALLHGIFGAD